MMERLTERLDNGVIRRTKNMGVSVMERLADYEDTGLSPERCAELAKAEDEDE